MPAWGSMEEVQIQLSTDQPGFEHTEDAPQQAPTQKWEIFISQTTWEALSAHALASITASGFENSAPVAPIDGA